MENTYHDADYIYDNSDNAQCVKIEVGLDIRVNKEVLEELQSNEYIKSNFKLNITRLNRWYYRVYFDTI